MGRYDELMKKYGMDTGNNIQPGDETNLADNPRNWLADKVNPYLDKIGLPIPKMTVADEKNFQTDLPSNMAGSAMGSIGKVDGAAGRFGNLLGAAEKPNFGNVTVLDDAAKGLGKTILKPSAADLASDAAKLKLGGKPPQMKASEVMEQLQNRYGDELMKRKDMVRKGQKPMAEYDSFKQDMLDKIRRGE